MQTQQPSPTTAGALDINGQEAAKIIRREYRKLLLVYKIYQEACAAGVPDAPFLQWTNQLDLLESMLGEFQRHWGVEALTVLDRELKNMEDESLREAA